MTFQRVAFDFNIAKTSRTSSWSSSGLTWASVFRDRFRSSRSLSLSSIKALKACDCLTVSVLSWRAKKRSRIRSFSSKPRRQRHFNLLKARSPIRSFSARVSSASVGGVLSKIKLSACDQTARETIISLILPIARVGFNPLGQTSTQFMIVWQRNRRYGSSRLSSRSALPWSRLSARKR